jgi:hypothetical protein
MTHLVTNIGLIGNSEHLHFSTSIMCLTRLRIHQLKLAVLRNGHQPTDHQTHMSERT